MFYVLSPCPPPSKGRGRGGVIWVNTSLLCDEVIHSRFSSDDIDMNCKSINKNTKCSVLLVLFCSMENNEITILLVDDEADILEFLGYNLEKEGYRVLKAKNGEKAVKLAREHKPQLIILDVMMPGIDGIETCSRIRNIPELEGTVIAFLSARGEDYSQIAGFDAGADDYITKPIKPKLFISRVQALLRRSKEVPEPGNIIALKEFTIDKDRYVVVKDHVEITLVRKEFELLQFLVSRPDKVVTREEIFSNVWGENVVVGDRTIDVHIRRIREKLGIESIKTIKGVGYKFDEE